MLLYPWNSNQWTNPSYYCGYNHCCCCCCCCLDYENWILPWHCPIQCSCGIHHNPWDWQNNLEENRSWLSLASYIRVRDGGAILSCTVMDLVQSESTNQPRTTKATSYNSATTLDLSSTEVIRQGTKMTDTETRHVHVPVMSTKISLSRAVNDRQFFGSLESSLEFFL